MCSHCGLLYPKKGLSARFGQPPTTQTAALIYAGNKRNTRHGLPTANTPAGMSWVTTLPAPNYTAGPNSYTRTNDAAAPQPNVGFDVNGFAIFQTGAPCCHAQRMSSRINLHSWSEHHPVAQHHWANVQNNAIEVQKYPITHTNIKPVVTKKRGYHLALLANLAKQSQ
jgi:hypothetical protein